MTFSRFLLMACLVCAGLGTSVAHAQTAQATPAPSTPPIRDDDARTLFSLGQTAYVEGRYQAALDYFQQAYDLSHRPQLMFNIGQAADRLRLDRRALAAFEQFLREVPDSPQHASTRARVELLQAAVAADDARLAREAEQARAVEQSRTAASPGSDPATDSSRSPALGWAIAGGGGAALAVGAVFLALGLKDKSDVENAPLGSSFADVADAYDRASTRVTVGTVLLGVGAAAAATGVVLALTGRSSSDDAAPSAHLRILPGGLVIGGSF